MIHENKRLEDALLTLNDIETALKGLRAKVDRIKDALESGRKGADPSGIYPRVDPPEKDSFSQPDKVSKIKVIRIAERSVPKKIAGAMIK